MFLNRSTTAIEPLYESIALRAGILFTDAAIATNAAITALSTYDPVHGLGAITTTTVQKLDLLITAYPNQPELKATYEELLDSYKRYQKVKYKDKATIVLLARLQRDVTEAFNVMWAETKKQIEDRTGLPQLMPLSGAGLEYCDLDYDNIEAPKNERCVPLSELMTYTATGEDEVDDIMFCLPAEFTKAAFAGESPYKLLDREDPAATEPGAMWAERLITIPNINQLTAAEISAIRDEISATGKAFRTAADELIKQNIIGSDGYSAAETAAFFRDRIIPAAKATEEAFQSTEIFRRLFDSSLPLTGHWRIELWMGEMPVQQLWQYYHDQDIIPDETWEKLQSLRDRPEYNRRWPVLFLYGCEATEAANGDSESGQVASKRMTLSID